MNVQWILNGHLHTLGDFLSESFGFHHWTACLAVIDSGRQAMRKKPGRRRMMKLRPRRFGWNQSGWTSSCWMSLYLMKGQQKRQKSLEVSIADPNCFSGHLDVCMFELWHNLAFFPALSSSGPRHRRRFFRQPLVRRLDVRVKHRQVPLRQWHLSANRYPVAIPELSPKEVHHGPSLRKVIYKFALWYTGGYSW